MKKDLRTAVVAIAVFALVLAGLVFVVRMEPRILDKNEMTGEPNDQSAIVGYAAYEVPDVCKVKICCEPLLENGYASIYLTSPSDNNVLIRAELYSVKAVYDESTGQTSFLPDRLLGKTGFIHPGSYIEKVKVKGLKAGEEAKVLVKISTMYEASGTSNGAFYIRTNIK